MDPANPGPAPAPANTPSTGEEDPSLTPPGGENCQEYFVRAEEATPDFLIVLDKSGSMGGRDWPACEPPEPMDCTGLDFFQALLCEQQNNAVMTFSDIDRWTPSADALKGITANLDDTIRFGLMTFPSDDQCGPGNIDVPTALGSSGDIAAALDATCPNGATPTADSLDAALDYISSVQAAPDTVLGPQFVLLVTDGEPNCAGGGNPFGGGDAQAQQASYDAISALADAGVKTYVIGYDTQDNPELATVLDQMAQRGDTGDTAHRPVEDQASLEAEFSSIATAAISCTYVLDEAPPDPSYVQVVVDGEQRNLGDIDGWELGADGLSVELQGEACSTLQDGEQHTLQVEVKCAVVQPI